MGRRRVYLRYVCKHDGCNNRADFCYDSNRELFDSYEYRRYGDSTKDKWACVEHSDIARVLSPQKLRTVWVSQPVREEACGKFCGSEGVITGEGFYFEADEFPVGTVLRVTAEVILPEQTAYPEGE